jgi:DNA-binding response OmpR family regulator
MPPSRLLIVDDSHLVREALAITLVGQGHEVEQAEHGLAGWERLLRGGIDLVLLDIVMPVMDGFGLLDRIHADHELRELPVVILSNDDEVEHVARCFELGAEEFVHKPWNELILDARVRQLLERKRLRDREREHLRGLATFEAAASAIESGTFDPASLEELVGRDDSLGQLARVFAKMARDVQAREQQLRQEVACLRIEIDQAKRRRQFRDVVEMDYFQQLQERARQLRSHR